MKAMTLETMSSAEEKTPRLMRRRLRMEKNNSTMFSQEAWAGVWWTWNRSWSASQAWV
jgi:hypothetical protein